MVLPSVLNAPKHKNWSSPILTPVLGMFLEGAYISALLPLIEYLLKAPGVPTDLGCESGRRAYYISCLCISGKA